MPAHANRLMPTRLGNVLRAAESGVEDKYGIDPVPCWPALWLVLPDETRTEVTAARASLDTDRHVVAAVGAGGDMGRVHAVGRARRRGGGGRRIREPAQHRRPLRRARGQRSRPTSRPPAVRSPQRCDEDPRWPRSCRALLRMQPRAPTISELRVWASGTCAGSGASAVTVIGDRSRSRG